MFITLVQTVAFKILLSNLKLSQWRKKNINKVNEILQSHVKKNKRQISVMLSLARSSISFTPLGTLIIHYLCFIHKEAAFCSNSNIDTLSPAVNTIINRLCWCLNNTVCNYSRLISWTRFFFKLFTTKPFMMVTWNCQHTFTCEKNPL